MTTWIDGPLLGFDLETDGTDPLLAWPCQYAMVLRRDHRRMSINTNVVNPGRDMPQGAIDIHGITNERARAEGMALADAVELIVERLHWAATEHIPLVGMNLSYDLTIVHQLSGMPVEEMPRVLDVFVLDKHIAPFRKGKRTLSALCEHYGLNRNQREAHDAKNDAVSSIQVLLEMVRSTTWLGARTASELHDSQIKWADEQRQNLSDYFVKQGKPAIPPEQFGWPVQNGALSAPRKAEETA